MTQYLAECSNCHGLVNHLENAGVVSRCSRCKGTASDPETGQKWKAPHLTEKQDEVA